jgi:hypothetical protein
VDVRVRLGTLPKLPPKKMAPLSAPVEESDKAGVITPPVRLNVKYESNLLSSYPLSTSTFVYVDAMGPFEEYKTRAAGLTRLVPIVSLLYQLMTEELVDSGKGGINNGRFVVIEYDSLYVLIGIGGVLKL